MKAQTDETSAQGQSDDRAGIKPPAPPNDGTTLSKRVHAQVAHQPFFKGMSAQQIQTLADSAMEIEFEPGQWIYRQGEMANRFYVILEGKVLLESDVKEHGVVPIRTLGPGDNLGWAWLFPPHYMHFSAQAVEPVKAIFFYGTRLRQQCDENHALGYELMTRIAQIVIKNLNATQQRLMECVGRIIP